MEGIKNASLTVGYQLVKKDCTHPHIARKIERITTSTKMHSPAIIGGIPPNVWILIYIQETPIPNMLRP
jgi:hypothetical protein